MSTSAPLRLILMRHAKSSWDDPCIDDHDRVLNARGQRSARAMGDWLRQHNYVPDRILSSSAQRTVETAGGLGLDAVPALFTPSLYLAGPDHMLAQLHRAEGGCVLMLGHNPGVGWLAEMLVKTPPKHPRFHDYPTCATLVVEFEAASWADVQLGTGTVVDFITPGDLLN
ncbi:histidine phosphatase family protein [Rhodobacteraceae bacterium KMM 6894]|nr:histidine phosphatase family protein [Rhodobacteraceae bacterium KMM 6894]